jgi:hypothetical protein
VILRAVHVVVGGAVDDRRRPLARDEGLDGAGVADVERRARHRQHVGTIPPCADDRSPELTRGAGDDDLHLPAREADSTARLTASTTSRCCASVSSP